jgi:ketosteroid isomerase-like protein
MASADVEIVLAAIAAGNRQDVEAFVADASPEIEWEDAVFPGLAGTYHGTEEVREWFRQAVVEPWESIHSDVIDLVEAAPGRILVELCTKTRGKGSGVETELRFWQVVWLEGGRIRSRKAFLDRGAALAAAGLEPSA